MPKAKPDVVAKGLSLLARRQHSVKELERKLLDKGYSPEEVDPALAQFLDAGYLNDAEYARMMVRYYSGKGRNFLRFKLTREGVEREIIENVLPEDELEFARAFEVAEKKWSSLRGEERSRKEKLYRFLASRGFSGEVIQKAFTRLSES